MEENISKEPVTKNFQCSTCPKSFVRASSLEEHILNKHVEDKEYKCSECFKTKQLTKYFATKQILNKHRKRVHGPARFKCQVCFKKFIDPSNFTKHKLKHTQNKQGYKCDVCSKQLSTSSGLRNHLIYIHNEKREGKYLKCELCSCEFTCRSALELHVINKHVVDKAFECVVCSRTFIDQETFEKHMRLHNTEIKYFCDLCPNKGYAFKNSLVKHLREKHRKLFYYDNKCLRSFKDKSDFDEHISSSKQKIKCYICQKIIISECNLKIHMNSHVKEVKSTRKEIKTENKIIKPLENDELINTLESEQEFKCELCSKTFASEKYFATHRKQVHPNAKWKCNLGQCTKTFRWYYKLKLHRMEHAETKGFICHICEKAFYRPDSLKDHEKMHIVEKKFKCQMCVKSFLVSSKLRDHIAANHGGPKPFKCHIVNCGTSWATNYKLKQHFVSHKKVGPFKCDMCTTFRAFKSISKFKLHQRTVHSRNKKSKSHNTKTSDGVVFLCSSSQCCFETLNAKEMATHYNEKHGLPVVSILRDCLSPNL